MTPEQVLSFLVCTCSWGIAAHLRFRLGTVFREHIVTNRMPKEDFVRLAHIHVAFRIACVVSLLYMMHSFGKDAAPRFAHLILAFLVANCAWASLCRVIEQVLLLHAYRRCIHEDTDTWRTARRSLAIWCAPLIVCTTIAAFLVTQY